jgi:potassium efflux system protein
VLTFALTVGGSFLFSRLMRFVLEEDVYPRKTLQRGLPYAISTISHYLVLLVVFSIAIFALGIDTTKFAVLAGALGVGLGFGLQNIVSNFVSGLIVLIERPVNVGDVVEFGAFQGTFCRIGLRASVLRTGDGSEVLVPNASLISDKVVNWTLSDTKRRLEVCLGVPYGTNPETVLELLVRVARAHPDVVPQPPPEAILEAFGSTSLELKLQVWTDGQLSWKHLRSELMVRLSAALAAADIPLLPRS